MDVASSTRPLALDEDAPDGSLGGTAYQGPEPRLLGWSDATTGSIVLVVLALLAIRGSGRGGVSRVARVARRPVALPSGRDHLGTTHRCDGSLGTRSSRPDRTPPAHRTGRARDPIPAQVRFRILDRDGFRCRYCGRPASEPGGVLHVDHVVPVAAGGTKSEGNLRTACEECNLGKRTRAVEAVGP